MRRLFGIAIALMCAGCATYQPLPLAKHAKAPDNPASLKVDASALSLPSSRTHVFDPRHGLDMTDVAMLAVANNPQLKIARDDRGIARAQAFAAGLLPDPVLDFARGFPTRGPAASTSYDVGLSYDFTALLTHALGKRAARESAREVDLNLLWLEWQVIGEARQLFVRSVYEEKMLAALRDEDVLLEKHHAYLTHAHERGDVSLVAVSADQTRLQAVQTRRIDIERQLLATRQALNALLGLSPKASLHLTGPATAPAIDADEVARDLQALPRRRPDLLALQAGYESQDAHYRQAIWQQFPAIDIGFVQARDTDAISTRGFQVAITLPIFNRNRGNIAIEKATRQKLHDEYTQRLISAQADVEHIMQNQPLLERQRDELRRSEAIGARVHKELSTTAFTGDLSEGDRLSLDVNEVNQRLDLLSVEVTLLEQYIALQVLCGGTGIR